MLPTNALFTRKKESQAGRRFRTSIQPQQGSGNYYASNTITVNIPTAPNQLLIPSESTLNFTLNAGIVTSAAYMRLDSCGIHGIIQRVRIYHGSNLIEDEDQYGQLAKTLFDFQVPQDAAAGRHSVTGGTRSDAYALPQTVAADFGADDTITRAEVVFGVNRLAPVRYSNSGAALNPVLTAGTTFKRNFSINLISLVGSLSGGKYLPLFAMTAAPLRVEIQLVSSLNAFCACDQTDATWNLSNVEYVGEFLELSDAGINTIMSGSDSPLQFVCPGFANYQYSVALPNSQSQTSIPIAAKYSSLKSLICTIRNTAAGVNTATYYPYSSHSFACSQVYWRIGSKVIPSKPLTTNEEFFIETLKCFASISDQMYQPAVDLETYIMAAPVAATSGEPDGVAGSISNTTTVTLNGAQLGSGAFALGLDCEVFAGAERDAFFQGLNTNTDDIFLVINHNAANISARYDIFAMFDRVIAFENGTAYSRF
jgi:hypothetical protein